jgi:subtilisin family serine protease
MIRPGPDGRVTAAQILAPMVLDGNGNDTGEGGWAYPGNTQDGDTAHPNDLIGWNFVANTNNPLDDHGHGTHTAGTIGAMGNSGVGVAGLNWQSSLAALKSFNAGGSGSDSDIVAAVNYATLHGIPISNNSYGGGGYSQAMVDAINAAAAQVGHVFVDAAGNNGQNDDVTPFYPASYALPNMIAVAATDSSDRLAGFSNYGPTKVLLGAPGVGVLSTFPGNRYAFLDGTSMASPHVAGSVALLEAQHPDWTYDVVINQILAGVDPVSSLNGRVATGGRLNIGNSQVPAPGPAAGVRSATLNGYLGSGAVSDGRVVFNAPIDPATNTLDGLLLTGPNGSHSAVLGLTHVGNINTASDTLLAAQADPGTSTVAVGRDNQDPLGRPMEEVFSGRIVLGA